MARRRRSSFGATRVVVARAPAATPTIRIAAPAPIARRAARRAGHAARRVGRAAYNEKHTITALVAAGLLGLIEKTGTALPRIPRLSTAATYGLGAWAYGKYGRSVTAQHVATGLLSCAIRDFAAGKTTDAIVGDEVLGVMAGYDDDMSGEDEG